MGMNQAVSSLNTCMTISWRRNRKKNPYVNIFKIRFKLNLILMFHEMRPYLWDGHYLIKQNKHFNLINLFIKQIK